MPPGNAVAECYLDGWPFLASGRVIAEEGSLTVAEPFVGRVAWREGMLVHWPSGLAVASSLGDQVRIDSALRPAWMAPENVHRGFRYVARVGDSAAPAPFSD